MMATTPLPTAVTPTRSVSLTRPSPIVAQVYGEPRFHTEGDVAALAFASDGTLRSIDDAGVLRHWSADGRLLQRSYLSDLETLWAFAPGGKFLASGNDDLLFWNVADGQLLGRVTPASWLTALAFSHDGATLASGHDDGTVRFWDVATRQIIGEIKAHLMPIAAIAFSPRGDRLATAGEDRTIRVWDADSHTKLADLVSHTDRIPAMTWSADGTLLVSAGWDTSARVWTLPATDPAMLLNSHSDQVATAAFAPRGRLLATADSDFDIHLWSDPTAGIVVHVLRGHIDEIRCLAFSPDGAKLASAGLDRVIHVWETATGKLLGGPNPEGKHGIAVLPGPDGSFALASTGGPAFRLYDGETGAVIVPSDDGPAACVAASADGRWLAIGGPQPVTRLYDRSKLSAVPLKLAATKPPVGALAFSADGTMFAQTSPTDGLLWLWRTTGDEAFLIVIEAADGCTLETVAFHPDGKRVIVGGIDYLSTGERTGAVCVWDLETQLKEMVFDVGVYAVAADPTGRYIAGAGINDAVYLWDLTTDEQVFELAGHQGKINAVAFSPDGSYLLSAGDDQTVRIWDVLSGRLLVAREFDSSVQSLAVSTDGKTIFTGNGNTTCHRIEMATMLED